MLVEVLFQLRGRPAWQTAPPHDRQAPDHVEAGCYSGSAKEKSVRYVTSAMLVVVAIIHFLPVPGVLGPERLAALYGLDFAEPNLALLMRHRAVLFGLLGLFLLVAAFRPEWQPLAFVSGFVSVASFLWLAWGSARNPQVTRIVTADLVAIACLLVGLAAYVYERRSA